MMKYFVDESIFSGISEFSVPDGSRIRVCNEGTRLGVYMLKGDTFVRFAAVQRKPWKTLKEVYELATTQDYGHS